MIELHKDMNSIEGVLSDLAARTGRPQGYPFSKITLYSVAKGIERAFPEFVHKEASGLKEMRKLDFAKAGKVFGSKVQQMKNDLDNVPSEFIITAELFPPIDEPVRKTTGCRKYLIEVETEDCPEQWLAVQFRKEIKKYVTETLGLNIVPSVFGGSTDTACIPRVIVTIGNCKESLYQALQKYGEYEFKEYPIRLKIPSREFIANHLSFFDHRLDGFDVNISY